MVKFGKKYFFDEDTNSGSKSKAPRKKVNKKSSNKSNARLGLFFEKIKYFSKKSLPIIALLLLIILIIIYIKGCENNKNNKASKSGNGEVETNSKDPKIIDTINIGLNDEVPGIDRFVRNYSKVKGENDTIIYEDANFLDNKYYAVGEYKVTIVINGVEYKSRIIVTDKEAPILTVKDVIITEGEYYTINDFVSNCVDNSNKDCALDYEDQKYGKYTSAGTYDIKLYAIDLSGNKTESKKATLTIKAKAQNNNNSNGNSSNGNSSNGRQNGSGNSNSTNKCEYGDGTSSVATPIAYSLVKNGCAIDPKYAKTGTYITVPEKMGREELVKLKKDITNTNISAQIEFEWSTTPIFNKSGDGLIGYQVEFIARNNSNNKEEILHYYLNSNGSRYFVVNKLNLK